jgi:8-oxo-dGTP diphosphatase
MSPSMLITEPKVNSNLQCTTKVVHVCVAVIARFNEVSKAKEVLISKRLDHVHQGGLWEFPGGKVERGETIIDALDRELFEELDIRIKPLTQFNIDTEAFRPLIQIQHTYLDKAVFLDVWRVQIISGEPRGKEGQEVRWVDTNDLKKYDFPEANKSILKSCVLPSRYFITPIYTSILAAEVGLKYALNESAQLIYFRQPQLDNKEYLLWLKHLIHEYPELESKLMFQFAEALDVFSGAGIHLSFSRSKEYSERPIGIDKWFAVSCHNEYEVSCSTQINADFITLSPVLKTKSHPDQTEMGWDNFKRLVLAASVPVYGLGGLTKENEYQLMQSGAQGLAGIGFWQV